MIEDEAERANARALFQRDGRPSGWLMLSEELTEAAEAAYVQSRGALLAEVWTELAELRDQPLKVLCDLGGWKDPQTVLKCYQFPDQATLEGALRERKTGTNGQ